MNQAWACARGARKGGRRDTRLWLVAAAGVLHVTEEYVWPGGFLDARLRAAPSCAFAVNRTMAVVVNGLMFAVMLAAPFAAHAAPLFALSAAGLGAVNGWSHVAGTIRGRRYVPGVVTGLFVDQPVAAFAYLQFAWAGHLTGTVLAGSPLLGAAYHLVPLGDFATRRLALHGPVVAAQAPTRPPTSAWDELDGRPRH